MELVLKLHLHKKHAFLLLEICWGSFGVVNREAEAEFPMPSGYKFFTCTNTNHEFKNKSKNL